MKLTDTIEYKGLVPGETYIAVGTLMDKGTGEPFLDKDGNEVTARTPFEPEAPSGTVEVTFEFDTEGLAEGDELVVFEKVLDSAGNVVAAHEDIDSAEQSVVVDNPGTPEVPEEPYAKTGADAPDGTGYAAAAGIALAAAAGAGGALAYRQASPANGGGHGQRESRHGARRRRGVAGAGGARRPAAAREEPVRGARGARCGRGRGDGGSRDGRRNRLGRPSRLRRRMGARAGHDRRLPDRPGPARIARLLPHARRRRRKIRMGRSRHRRRLRAGSREPARHRVRAPHVRRHHVRAARAVLVARLRRGAPHHPGLHLEVFAADVVDASSEGKRTDFADAAALDAYLGDKLSRCEVVLEEPSDVAQAWAFVTCSYQTSNSRTVVYAKEVEGWDSRPSE